MVRTIYRIIFEPRKWSFFFLSFWLSFTYLKRATIYSLRLKSCMCGVCVSLSLLFVVCRCISFLNLTYNIVSKNKACFFWFKNISLAVTKFVLHNIVYGQWDSICFSCGVLNVASCCFIHSMDSNWFEHGLRINCLFPSFGLTLRFLSLVLAVCMEIALHCAYWRGHGRLRPTMWFIQNESNSFANTKKVQLKCQWNRKHTIIYKYAEFVLCFIQFVWRRFFIWKSRK